MCQSCALKFTPNQLPGIWNAIKGQANGGQALFNIDTIIEKEEVDVNDLEWEEIADVDKKEWFKRMTTSPGFEKVSKRR